VVGGVRVLTWLIECDDVDCWAVQKAVADDGKNWFEEVSVCCAF